MKYFFTSLSLLILLAACSQKQPVITPNRADMLRSGKWRISSGKLTAKIASGKDTVLDYFNYIIPTCHQDDYIIFDSSFTGSIYSGANKCNPGDAASIPFKWRLSNNDNNISFYDGFNSIWGFTDTVYTRFDTSSFTPLVIDTLRTVLDTVTHTYSLVVLDTLWRLKLTPAPIPDINIYNAAITNFSQSAFTIHFTYITKYPDTTDYLYRLPARFTDTMHFEVTYSNF